MNGTLIAIGGGLDLRGPILPEFFRLSGGTEGQILILPTASELDDSGYDCAAALAALGLRRPAQVLPIRSRADAGRSEFCKAAHEATGIFITGGNQNRLTAILQDTCFSSAVREMFERGGTIAGTSAGTAALSEVMIASGYSGMLPQKNIARLSTGLGLINSCVFDQHFRQRNRIGRLLYAVACHPTLLGVGVDENTAAVICENELRVIGSGAVTLVDGHEIPSQGLQEAPDGDMIALGGVQLHILTQGARYDMHRRKANLATKQDSI